MRNPNQVLVNFLAVNPIKTLSSEYIYALKASKLKAYNHLENLSLLVYEDIPLSQEYYQISGLNLILVKDPKSFHALQLKLQDIFDEQARINNYAYQLMELCHQNANKQKLLDAAYSVINNPILLLDTNLALIASVGAYTGIAEPVINYCLQNNHMPESFLKEMVNETSLPADNDWPSLITLERGSHNFVSTSIIAGRVIRGNQLLGYIKVFEYNHPVTDLEKRNLIILCKFMSIAMTDSLPYLPVNNVRIEDFMADLLSRRITAKDAIDSRVFLYHLDNTQPNYAVSIKYNAQATTPDRLYHFKRQLINMFGVPTIIFFDQMIAMIIPRSIWMGRRQEFQQFLSLHKLIAGVSLPFISYKDAAQNYSQTLACLDMRCRFSLKETLIDYDDWKTTHIFLHLQDCCDLHDLIPESISILDNYDKTRGTALVETLFAYVHHRQNITEAAAELHLHYNTMKYRINQIIELTNIDFDDYDYMFSIMIAEKVAQILKMDVTLSNSYTPGLPADAF